MPFWARAPREQRRARAIIRTLAAVAVFLVSGLTRAAQIEEGQKLFLEGQYSDAVKLARESLQAGGRSEEWLILLTKTLLTLGQYADAQATVSNALDRNFGSLRLRLIGHEAYLQNGQTDKAKELIREIGSLSTARPWAYRDSANVVALGQAALLLGGDPRRVLDNMFNRVKQADPACRDAYLAIGELALDKYDSDLAGKTFQEGLDHFEDDPDMLWGLAKAYSSGDRTRSQMLPLLEKALGRNPRHVPTLLLLADHLIDSEEYKKADEMLNKVLAVNPHHPDAWAYRAVLAQLRNEPDKAEKDREMALGLWKTNPRVDYLIGEKLSQKYRFTEGSSYQRRALKSDEGYLPAKGQLAQDLLRLGEEEEGWALAEDVYKQDGYDVLAYNLVTLHDTLAKFQVLTNSEFKVHMQPQEAAVYGARVLELLERAKRTLSKKYSLDLSKQTVVEIFPEQKDFAVRTFGMPGGEGFLGVCFGSVITANSPASQAAQSINWQSVLWHEFCHVITLTLTHNKMPRWLSEGISVYEERQANPAWGEHLTGQYREMIREGDLTPIGNLSAAFLAPKTPFHLQFAYYESSLVVEYLVDHFGLDALKKLLGELAEGKPINQAIEDTTAPLAKLEKDFDAFVRQQGDLVAPGLDWAEPKAEDLAKNPEGWMKQHPKSIYTLTQRGKKLLAQKKWEEAKKPLQELIDLYPRTSGHESGYLLIAQANRGLNETDQERAALNKLVKIDGNASEANLRLMELDSDAKDWAAARRDAERFLAINPLVPQPYRCLASASEGLGKDAEALQAYRTLLLLDPPDPADVHYHLALLLKKAGDPEAKRQVLQALEEAPRFRAAHRLLLQLSGAEAPQASNSAKPQASVGSQQ
jgi:tetratricopeptide (TPR) repeat protein